MHFYFLFRKMWSEHIFFFRKKVNFFFPDTWNIYSHVPSWAHIPAFLHSCSLSASMSSNTWVVKIWSIFMSWFPNIKILETIGYSTCVKYLYTCLIETSFWTNNTYLKKTYVTKLRNAASCFNTVWTIPVSMRQLFSFWLKFPKLWLFQLVIIPKICHF